MATGRAPQRPPRVRISEGKRLRAVKLTGTPLGIGSLFHGGNVNLNRGVSLYSGGRILNAPHSLVNIAGGSVGLSKDSVILLEQIRTIDKRRLREHMGRLDEKQMSMVDDAIAVSFGLPETRN